MNHETSPCDQLDDFLDGYLTVEQRSHFESHVEVCSHCRYWLEQQQSWDQSVRQYAQGITPPVVTTEPGTSDPSAGVPTRDTRSTLALVAVLAAVLLAAIGIHFLAKTPASSIRAERAPSVEEPLSKPTTPEMVEAPSRKLAPPPSQTPFPLPAAPIQSLRSSSHLAVVQPPEEDDVTFVMLYPKLTVNQENENEQ